MSAEGVGPRYEPISERYLVFQRIITFLDEWLFYLVLIYLYEKQRYGTLVAVAIFGAVCVLTSYRRQWAMEAKRFGPMFDEERPKSG